MERKSIIAFVAVTILAAACITTQAKRERREKEDMRIINVSVELSDAQYMAIERRAARFTGADQSWNAEKEITYIAEAAVTLTANEEFKKEEAALRNAQLTDDFIVDDTPIRVVAAQKEEQTLSDDPEGEPAANADSSHKTEANDAKRVATTQQERDLFLRCIQAEAGNQPIEGRQAAAEVILNRVEDARFPGTITEVIMQPGQFGVVSNGSIYNVTPDETTIKAVDAALDGANVLPMDAQYSAYVFFNNKPIGRNVIQIGDHYFGR